LGLAVEVQFACSRRGVPHVRSFAQWAQQTFVSQVRSDRKNALKQAEVTIRIVGIAEGRRLNRQWRERDYATNVLSFPAMQFREGRLLKQPAESAAGMLGDLVICAPVVTREAREQCKVPRQHWAHMVVHGVMHLLGYDHIHDRDATLMEKAEVRVLAQFGFADPYG
jgi:probable rRNA maturation factor